MEKKYTCLDCNYSLSGCSKFYCNLYGAYVYSNSPVCENFVLGENKKNCLDCHYCLECDGVFVCADTGIEIKDGEFCPNFAQKGSVEYEIYLTEQEIQKTINLIEVVVEPLRKVVKKSIIPKQKREAQQVLDEVDGLLNKFKIYKENEKC